MLMMCDVRITGDAQSLFGHITYNVHTSSGSTLCYRAISLDACCVVDTTVSMTAKTFRSRSICGTPYEHLPPEESTIILINNKFVSPACISLNGLVFEQYLNGCQKDKCINHLFSWRNSYILHCFVFVRASVWLYERYIFEDTHLYID